MPSPRRKSQAIPSSPERFLVPYSQKLTQDERAAFVEEFRRGGDLTDLVKLYDGLNHYKTTNDHTKLPSLLILCNRLKVYPPPAVLSHLAQGLKEYSGLNNKKSLDKCLGIKGLHGQRSLATQTALANRDRCYVEKIEFLKTAYNLRLQDACAFAAHSYEGTARPLNPETIQRKWKSSAWKAYKKIPDSAPGSGNKQSQHIKGKPFTLAKILMPMALHIGLAKKIPSERSACLQSIENRMHSAKGMSDPFNYLPRIKKVLEDKKTYRHPSKRLSALATILREARDDPKNLLEIPKTKSPKMSNGDPLLSYL